MQLELFYREGCPHSERVRHFIVEKGLKSRIDYRNVRGDQWAYSRLVDMTCEDEVPCLAVDGAPLLDPDDIIGWLKSNCG